jgi:predicted nucleic acid-binding protein
VPERIVLDTDVASLLFKDRLPAGLYAKLVGRQLVLTYVSVGELTRWPIARDWGGARRSALDAWLASKPTIPGTVGVVRKWGEIIAYADRRGRPRPVNDSWIAACCLAYDLLLATLNVVDYADFVEHEGLHLITD